MRKFAVFLVTVIALIIVGYYLYKEAQFQQFEILDNHFMIEKRKDIRNKNAALQALVNVRRRLDHLTKHLKKKYPGDVLIDRLNERFDGTILKEANPDKKNPKQTSYTINKGDVMVLCLRTPDGKLVDLNTLTYVAIHELAHIYSSSLHHTPEFWENMKYLVKEGIDAGIYDDVNYAENPVKYCGLSISSNLPK